MGAVAGVEGDQLAVELELDAPADDVEQLLRVAVAVGLVAGRASGLELGDDDLEELERLRCQHRLPAERSPGERTGARRARTIRGVATPSAAKRSETSTPSASAMRCSDCDRRAGLPPLELAEEALAERRTCSDVAQREPARLP